MIDTYGGIYFTNPALGGGIPLTNSGWAALTEFDTETVLAGGFTTNLATGALVAPSPGIYMVSWSMAVTSTTTENIWIRPAVQLIGQDQGRGFVSVVAPALEHVACGPVPVQVNAAGHGIILEAQSLGASNTMKMVGALLLAWKVADAA